MTGTLGRRLFAWGIALLGLATLATSLFLPACQGDGDHGIPFNNNQGNDAARIVAEVDGLLGDPGDAGRKLDGVVVPVDAGDGGPTTDGRQDTGNPTPKDAAVDVTPTPMCDLVKQDCPATKACYPLGAGVTACAPAGALEGGPTCGEDEQCARGLLCGAEHAGTPSCLPICHPTLLPCELNIPCVAITGFAPIGICEF